MLGFALEILVPIIMRKKKKKKLIACRGLGKVVGPLLAARALPLRCAASTMLSSTLLKSYLIRIRVHEVMQKRK
jgi:hypothetical protein